MVGQATCYMLQSAGFKNNNILCAASRASGESGLDNEYSSTVSSACASFAC